MKDEMRDCERCGNSFRPRFSFQKYDNPTCRRKAETENRAVAYQVGRAFLRSPVETAANRPGLGEVHASARRAEGYTVRSAKCDYPGCGSTSYTYNGSEPDRRCSNHPARGTAKDDQAERAARLKQLRRR